MGFVKENRMQNLEDSGYCKTPFFQENKKEFDSGGQVAITI